MIYGRLPFYFPPPLLFSDTNRDGILDKKDCPPFLLNIAGYSWGAWSALILAHDLGPNFQIRMGLVDAVNAQREQQHTKMVFVNKKNEMYRAVPYGPKFGTKPANVVADVNYYETIGQKGQFWIFGGIAAGNAIQGFDNHDVTTELNTPENDGDLHGAIIKVYGAKARSFAFDHDYD